jgi:YrbI family 3-deoxy-D-manno-octulosonate 8-phosphate phosphatase
LIDPKYTVDIDTLSDWAKYEALVDSGLEMVSPGKSRRAMPETIKLIIFDFDGVVTDNLVITDQDGKESVTASRSDSMHIRKLQALGVETMIISSEPNPVVMARAKKMGVDAIHNVGLHDKGRAMRGVLDRKNLKAENVIYLGNDLNDLPCFEIAGWSVAVADAYPEVIRAADHVLTKTGGHGAIRELCEMVLKQLSQKEN